MEAAYKEAQKAFKEDEVPVGCVIVKDDEIIADANNRKVKKDCAVYHAEIECRRLTGKQKRLLKKMKSRSAA